MTYTVRLREEAEFDLEEAASWYEAQRPGLGHDFLDTALEMLTTIEQNPFSFPVVHRHTHRAVVPRFPFAVFYCVQDSEISVISSCTVVGIHQDGNSAYTSKGCGRFHRRSLRR